MWCDGARSRHNFPNCQQAESSRSAEEHVSSCRATPPERQQIAKFAPIHSEQFSRRDAVDHRVVDLLIGIEFCLGRTVVQVELHHLIENVMQFAAFARFSHIGLGVS